jgi:hypothetical protein
MPDIHPISARNIVPAIVPVLEVQSVHAQTESEVQQTLLTAQTTISKSLMIPLLTSSLLSQALEGLKRELLRLPENVATQLLEILRRMQSPQIPMVERTQFFSISKEPTALFALLQEFVSLTSGNPVMNPANAAALQMIQLMERQLVINLHAIAAGLPMKIFIPLPNENHHDVAEFTYDNADKLHNHLRHFSLKMETKTMGEISVTGAELDKRLHVGFHAQNTESVRRLMDNFTHLRSALESQQFTITGLTATLSKSQRNTAIEPTPHISVTA